MLKKIMMLTSIVVVFGGLIIFMFFRKQPTKKKEKLQIVCTTNIIAETLHHLVGDMAHIYSLMGPGVDPHLYRAKESDVERLMCADIIFYNGLYLEGKMAEVLKKMSGYTNTVAVGDAIAKNKLRPSEFEGIYDPHIWHDVGLWMYVVEYMRDSLIAFDSIHQDEYKQYAEQFLNKLKELDGYIKKYVQRISKEQRILITAHDAFAYFGRAYGFDVVGLQGISTNADISTRDIQQLAELIVKKQISAIFVESSIPHRTIEAVQKAVEARRWSVEIGTELLSDALGNPGSASGTYIGMIKHNVDAIVSALATK